MFGVVQFFFVQEVVFRAFGSLYMFFMIVMKKMLWVFEYSRVVIDVIFRELNGYGF